MNTATKQRAVQCQLQLSRTTVTAGETIHVTIDTLTSREVLIRGGEITLARTVNYRYREVNAFGGMFTVPTHRTDIVGRQDLAAAGRLRPGVHDFQQVELTVPADELGTATAALVDISWAVTTRIDIQGEPAVETTRAITVLSGAPQRSADEEKPPVVLDRGCAVLGFESLSDRWVSPGSELSGVLTVVTGRPVSARGLRVELVLREQVHHGPWIGDDPAHNPAYQEMEEETTVASTAVAAHSDFLTEQPRRFPFRISVPKELPAPSMQTPEFTVTWILRAVLDRALRHDPYVEIEMHGTTAPHRPR